MSWIILASLGGGGILAFFIYLAKKITRQHASLRQKLFFLSNSHTIKK